MNRVAIKPQLLRWACERAGFDVADLEHKFPRLTDWMSGAAQPTLKQLETFANATHTPVGYLFLPEPPVEKVPIPDFRTPGSKRMGHPSPDLLDTIYVCQQRQEWFRNYARSMGESPLAFVGSALVGDDVVSTASRIRTDLEFDLDARRRIPTWTDALRRFIEQADNMGILVMCNGVVHKNNYRHLDPRSFAGLRWPMILRRLCSSMARTRRRGRCLPWRMSWRTYGWDSLQCRMLNRRPCRETGWNGGATKWRQNSSCRLM